MEQVCISHCVQLARIFEQMLPLCPIGDKMFLNVVKRNKKHDSRIPVTDFRFNADLELGKASLPTFLLLNNNYDIPIYSVAIDQHIGYII